MKNLIFTLILSIIFLNNSFSFAASEPDFPGKVSDFHGYVRHDFQFQSHNCIIVEPKTPADGNPWIWRARFFGHEPQTDKCLLARGFHVAFIDCPDMFGSPNAVKLWDDYYNYLTTKFKFNKKPALEGMSRGGLFVFNWAKANPDKVSCIYADAPVCDISSWPSSQRKVLWQAALKQYNLTDQTVATAKINPIDNLELLAKAKVPILIVAGDADQVVPIEANSYIFRDRYQKLDGPIKMIVKPGVDHHPHSLKDPTEIVKFIVQHTNDLDRMYYIRDQLQNSRLKFTREKKGTVAFLGGSITYNPGWRPMVCEYLQKEFPDTEFTFIAAGIPSLGSIPGTFRMDRDILSKGKVDLLFQEAAVNDKVNNQNPDQVTFAMSGIVEHARSVNPDMDIVFMYFVDPEKMKFYNSGQSSPIIDIHEKVARKYHVSGINLALEVTDRINTGEFTWKDDFKNLHPSPFGQKIYFNSIKRFLELCWANPIKSSDRIIAHQTPHTPNSYNQARLADVHENWQSDGFKVVENFKPTDAATRDGFVNIPVLEATETGAELKYQFKGNAIGLFVICGPDAGKAQYSIDGKQYPIIDFFTPWSRGLHLPRAYVLADELSDGSHELILKMIEDQNPRSKGHACRIAHFLVNSPR
ncbi:MAG: prolyl oligopeptidase family serine peptidase [Phycisphaerae bacterium]|nr:prolyl oligopeptidase family serine peptidase [Phycisphaerae bacterium]